MKILFIAESFSLKGNTGVATTAIALARSLTSQGLTIEAAAPISKGESIDLGNIKTHLFEQPQRLPRTVVPELGRFLAKEVSRFDLVHLHGLWRYPQWMAARVARRSGVPYVISPHGMCEPYELARKGWKKKLYFNLMERRTFEGASAIHGITSAEREHCLQLHPQATVEVIPHGVRLPNLASLVNESLPAEIAAIPQNAPVVLYMGRLHPKKGLDLLLPAFAEVLKCHPEAHLVVAGPDISDYQRHLMATAQGLGIGTRIVFPGMVVGDSKDAMLRRADVFTLPSYSEGFSAAVLEALAMAKPVVISKFCYFDEVQQADCGFVIDCEVSQLSTALNQVLSLPASERSAMGVRSRALVEQHYTWPMVAQQMQSLYELCQHRIQGTEERVDRGMKAKRAYLNST